MPTLKQKAAVKKVLENRGVAIGKIMASPEVGYAEKTAKNPKNLTESKGWQELMEEYLPDKDLAKVHQELLHKKEVIIIHTGKKSKVEITEQPHSDTKGALDMGYKLKGKYAPEHIKHSIDENEIDEQIAKLRAEIADARASEKEDKTGEPGA